MGLKQKEQLCAFQSNPFIIQLSFRTQDLMRNVMERHLLRTRVFLNNWAYLRDRTCYSIFLQS